MPRKKAVSGLAKMAANYKKELAERERINKNLLQLFDRAIELDELGYSIEYIILVSQIVDEFLIRCIREQESLIRLQLDTTDFVSFNSDFEAKLKNGLTSGKLVAYYKRYSRDEKTKIKLDGFVKDRNELVHKIIKNGIETLEKKVSKRTGGELVKILAEEARKISEEKEIWFRDPVNRRLLASKYLRNLEKSDKN